MAQSIIDTAAELLSNKSKITYQKIAEDTGLQINWLRNFLTRYKKGQDFHARKVETLIKYLSKDTQ